MLNAASESHLIAVLAAMISVLPCDADTKERQVSPNAPLFSEIPGCPGDGSVVPITLEGGEIIVDVTIDGKGPFPMMFDTGSLGAVTPETAALLSLKVEGSDTIRGSGEAAVPVAFARVKEMRLGAAELLDQPMLVLPLPRFVTDRGDRPPLAGVVGYELLARFAARLDYDHRMLTLAPARDFHYRAGGKRAPLAFVDKLPVIPAAVDGIAGKFEIDTGSSAALVLQRKFVEQHGLEDRHPGGLHMKSGGGADGVFETIITRVDRFGVANTDIVRPAAEFPEQGRSGTPLTGVDGSIGFQILRQFVITFDYSREEVWFEGSSAFGTKTVQWKTGFQAAKIDGPDFRVVTVLSDSPAAAAGIKVGDLITAVDGRPAASVGQAEFGDLMRRQDGTSVRLSVVGDGRARSVVLILEELLQ